MKERGALVQKKHINFEDVPMCPFLIRYSRRIDAHGNGISPYVLKEFEFTHSHPLSLEYEKVLLQGDAW